MNLLDDQTDDQIVIDQNKNYLEELVGEGKKFKTVEDLAKGKYEADMFIQSKNRQYDGLIEEYTKLREEYNAGATLQEMLDQLKQQQTSSSTNTQTNEETKPALTPDNIESIVSSQFQKQKQMDREENNLNLVMEKVRERFGENFKSSLKTQAENLGLSTEDVNRLARSNPKLFFKTFDITENKQQQNFQTPPTNQKRSDSFAPKSDKRTLSYYENMRRTKPDLYLDPKISIQMDKDAQALGAEFFDV